MTVSFFLVKKIMFSVIFKLYKQQLWVVMKQEPFGVLSSHLCTTNMIHLLGKSDQSIWIHLSCVAICHLINN